MRFSRALRRAERGLGLAGPGRTRILLEMSQDLEGLYRAYVAKGLEPGEAERRAEAVVGTSPEAVAELARLHATPLTLLLARYSMPGTHRVERAMLTGVTLAAVLGSIGALTASGIARSPSPFLWPLVVLGAIGAGMLAARAVELFGAVVRPAPLARLSGILLIAAACVATGAGGAAHELWLLAGRATDGPLVTADLARHLAKAAELMTLAISAALALSVGWFHLRLRAISVVRADAEVQRLIQSHEGGAS